MTTPNLQTTFDTIARHLLTQGHQAWDGKGCVYRAPNGDRCAVGAIIPDDLYTSKFEGESVECLLGLVRESDYDWLYSIIGGANSIHQKLLVDLQRIHDCLASVNWPLHDIPQEVGSKLVNRTTHEFDIPNLKQALTVVASRFGLSSEVLQ